MLKKEKKTENSPSKWFISKNKKKENNGQVFFFLWDREDWVWKEGWAKVLFCLGATGTSEVGGGMYTKDKKRNDMSTIFSQHFYNKS